MRFKSILSLILLTTLLLFIVPFCVSQSYADVLERNQITETITQKKARWSPRDTSLSLLNREQRTKRFGSVIPTPTGTEKIIIAPAVSMPLKLDWRNYDGNNYVTPVRDQGGCSACWEGGRGRWFIEYLLSTIVSTFRDTIQYAPPCTS